MKIIVDSREQLPYEFPGEEVTVEALFAGDYSILGLEREISIERKELSDLIGCLTTSRERFERELYRMKSLTFGAVVVECSFADIVEGNFRSKMNAQSAVQSILSFMVRYDVPFIFAGTRTRGQMVTWSLLLKFAKQIREKAKKIDVSESKKK